MKILVFSDSHGKAANIKKAISDHLELSPIDHIFFLGDGIRDFSSVMSEFPNIPCDYVLGNCDSFYMSETDREFAVYEKVVEACGIRFFITHGHKLFVKSGIQLVADYGIAKMADIVLFGHTHTPVDVTIDGSNNGFVRLINPGSCGGGLSPTYAVLNVVNYKVLCGFGRI